MLYADALRGWDATGVFGVDRLGNIDIKKQAAAAGHFINTPQYTEFNQKIYQKYHAIVGHNRKATSGERKHVDAHPFWDEGENICLVHNGMISNHKSFCTKATVDSASIANALAREDVTEVISKVEGAFAFIWYNVEKKQIYFIRNMQRPLYISETDGSFILSSEQALPLWICSRNEVKIDKVTPVIPMKLYTYDLESHKIIEGETIELKKKYIPATTSQVTTIGTTTTSANSDLIDDYTVLGEQLPLTHYITDADIQCTADVYRNLARKDSVCIMIDTYDKPDGHQKHYILEGQLLNVTGTYTKVMMYLHPNAFHALDITKVLVVDIINMIMKHGEDCVTLFASNPKVCDSTTTATDVVITDAMWYDDSFPLECSSCNEHIKYKTLSYTSVWLKDKEVSVVLCPTCSGELEK